MIITTLLAISSPLFVSLPQDGQDYVLRQVEDYSVDVITLREDPNADSPLGFATLEITREHADGDFDILLTRLDKNYNVIWKRQFGGDNNDFGRKVIQTHDGGLLVSAHSLSTPSPTSRAVLVKFDGNGNMIWARCYPGQQFNTVQGTAHTELGNGNIMLVSGLDGLGVTGSFDGVQTIVDPAGNMLSSTRIDVTLGWNTPSRIIYRAIVSNGLDSAATGVIHHVLDDGSMTINSFIHRFPDIPAAGAVSWFNEYPVIVGLPDWGTGIAWTADDSLVVAGALGNWAMPPMAGFGYRVQASTGVMASTGMIYPELILNDVVEDIDPVTDPNSGKLCFAGYLLREPDITGLTGFDASLMLTDPFCIPIKNMYYDPTPWGAAVSVTPHYATDGYPLDGYFGLGTSFSIDYVAPTHQHWMHADLDIKTGCLEDEYELHVAKSPIDPLNVDSGPSALDGDMNLDWFVIDPDLEVVDICEDDDDPVFSICFGDGLGTPCPCGNTGGTGEGCAHSTGVGAILSATGTPSISADTLTLNVSQGTPNQPVLFFQGINFINSGNGVVFGDGLRCCGGSVIRLQVRSMSAAGDASTTVVLSVRGSASAGDTFCNQSWFRDPSAIGGSPCMTFFNLSNALSVTWLP